MADRTKLERELEASLLLGDYRDGWAVGQTRAAALCAQLEAAGVGECTVRGELNVDSIDSCLPLWTRGKLGAFLEALS